MSTPPEPSSTVSPGRRPGARLRLAAAVVLATGLIASAGVWVAADDTAWASRDASDRIVAGQVDALGDAAARDRQTERLGGRALVRTAAFSRWLGSLWHGRRLAWTLVVLAVVLSAACAWIAALMDAPVDD